MSINSGYEYKGDGLYVYAGPKCRPPPDGHRFELDREIDEPKGHKTKVFRCKYCRIEYGKCQ